VNEKTQEQLYSSLQRGMRATADLAVALPLLSERREGLIAQAIADYNATMLGKTERPFDGMRALLFVAALAENARLKDDLEHVERLGRRDGARLAAS
jgi:hypothetical protein